MFISLRAKEMLIISKNIVLSVIKISLKHTLYSLYKKIDIFGNMNWMNSFLAVDPIHIQIQWDPRSVLLLFLTPSLVFISFPNPLHPIPTYFHQTPSPLLLKCRVRRAAKRGECWQMTRDQMIFRRISRAGAKYLNKF